MRGYDVQHAGPCAGFGALIAAFDLAVGLIITAFAIGVVIIPPAASVAAAPTETCLTGTAPDVINDATQIKALRTLIDSTCACSSFDGSKGRTHKDYVKCVSSIIAAQVPDSLRAKCAAIVKSYYARSTCGWNPNRHAEPCVSTSVKSGKVTCAIKPSTKKDGYALTNACSDKPGKSTRVSCPSYYLCIDAADTNGDLIIAAPSDNGMCVPTPTPTPTPTSTPAATPTCNAGQACSTGQLGICAAGTTACIGGAIVCNQNQQPQAEVCNGLDDDCDGAVDEGNPGGGVACSTGQLGICAAGTTACIGDAIVCNQNQQPQAEVCNGLDDDCDGAVDEGNPGGGVACSTGRLGICAAGTTSCTGGAIVCNQNQQPQAEVCNGLDDDCDGAVDEGNPGGGVACNTGKLGVCAAGTTACVAGVLRCNQNVPASPEVCNGLDDDCDGVVDNGATCTPGRVCVNGACQ